MSNRNRVLLDYARTNINWATERSRAYGSIDRESGDRLLKAVAAMLAYLETHPVLTVSDKMDDSTP